MSALQTAAHRWRTDSEMPEGITVTPVDIESGHAVSSHSGRVHIVADAARLSDGITERLVAMWLCGGSVTSAFAVESVDDLNVCPSCVLAARVPQRPCVYFAYGVDDELLYVGSTGSAMQRIRSHSTGTSWWGQVRRLTFAEYDSLAEARAAEAEAIWKRPGLHNKNGTKAQAGPDFLCGIEIGGETA